MKLKYRINIIWSDENDCYLVGLPDFPGQQWRTHGETYSEAFKHGMEVMEELHLAAINGDIPIPDVVTAESTEFQTA
ncbi:MAG: type II toxin-antitoxin system HicB family antitoxin [Waterburya sp.]